MSETAIVVRVEAAEAAVGAYRRRHTPCGAEGMPAHITLLSPFADGQLLVSGMVREVRETLAECAAFRFVVDRLARFDGTPGVLYGAPDPADPFIAMTQLLADRFGFLPYGGEHAEVVPHLTIATRLKRYEFDRIEAEVCESLPIESSADAAEIWEHRGEGWRMVHSIDLARN